jgi:hypothetical protein
MSPLSALTDFIASGGIPMAPVLVTAVLVVATTVTAWRTLHRAGPEDARSLEGRIDGILFWGFFGAVLGVLGTLGGLAQMAKAIQAAGGAVATTLVWGGIQNALTTTIVGLATLSIALPAWYLLRRRWLRHFTP